MVWAHVLCCTVLHCAVLWRWLGCRANAEMMISGLGLQSFFQVGICPFSCVYGCLYDVMPTTWRHTGPIGACQ